ncbi:GerAB/ArcD/ProY family transporter [Neobacillus cucumis]|uniref:GerAB/ArcD/ProY family transporter n=1 Tax=Neobacillus cucumis TaxID=1740721 RepID=UPI00285308B9|nr:endospore germination permease [Neobacillus cucumis]MDR4947555.1 endospore germination permease [Neobacillus cucumis]
MKQKVSAFQLSLLVANLIVAGPVISLPQIILQQGNQNAWMIPIIIYPILITLILIIFGKNKNTEWLQNVLLIGNKSKWVEKGFVILFLFFSIFTLVRDLRGMFDFVATVLLPTTPNDILMVLSILVIVYIAISGIEVIARVTAIHFGLLFIIVTMLPLLLMNEWNFGNLQPLLGSEFISTLSREFFVTFSWLGEILFFLIILANIDPPQKARRAVIIGTGLGIFLFVVVLMSALAVLGVKIIRESIYPSLMLIQQINITDFLDRLDLVITVAWLPTIFTKVAFLLYAINHCFSYLYKGNTNKFLFPIAFIVGYLSILMFKNTMDLLRFSFYTWNLVSFFIQLMIIFLFLFVKRNIKMRLKNKEAET